MKLVVLIFSLFCSAVAISQQNDTYYVFNSEWKPTAVDSAKYMLHIHRISDTCWQWDYYHSFGPLLRTEQYRNHDGEEMDGICNHFNESGYLDSTAIYRRGRKNGDFFKISGDEKHHRKLMYRYKDDSLLEVRDVDKEVKDSSKKYEDQKESEYPGGMNHWKNYLYKNLRYPEHAFNSQIEGDVRVAFIVDSAGQVENVYIAKSVEYSLDEEAMRIVRESGKWIPAFQNGKHVKSYKVQPIYFRLR